MRNSSRLILNCSLVISTLSINLSTGTRLAAASAFRNISDPTGGDYACAPVIFREKVKHIFKVEIHDIDLSVLPEFGLTYETYFPEADSLAKFILDMKNAGMDIICQCEYGESRSAGCAAAILEYFYGNGISIFAD